jgi:hypothetical protein
MAIFILLFVLTWLGPLSKRAHEWIYRETDEISIPLIFMDCIGTSLQGFANAIGNFYFFFIFIFLFILFFIFYFLFLFIFSYFLVWLTYPYFFNSLKENFCSKCLGEGRS